MNAWLITWEYFGEHAKVSDKIVAILDPRKSRESVIEIVKLHWLRNYYNANENSYYSTRPRKILFEIDTSEGEIWIHANNPSLRARIVSEFKVTVNNETNTETISWREPDKWKWIDEKQSSDLIHKGIHQSINRPLGLTLGKDLEWNDYQKK